MFCRTLLPPHPSQHDENETTKKSSLQELKQGEVLFNKLEVPEEKNLVFGGNVMCLQSKLWKECLRKVENVKTDAGGDFMKENVDIFRLIEEKRLATLQGIHMAADRQFETEVCQILERVAQAASKDKNPAFAYIQGLEKSLEPLANVKLANALDFSDLTVMVPPLDDPALRALDTLQG